MAYILATASGCKSYTNLPADLPTPQDGLQDYLHELSVKIVHICFMPPNKKSVLNANTSKSNVYKYCLCKSDTGEEMINCDNKKCCRGKWFHFSCVDVNESNTDLFAEWFSQLSAETGNILTKL